MRIKRVSPAKNRMILMFTKKSRLTSGSYRNLQEMKNNQQEITIIKGENKLTINDVIMKHMFIRFKNLRVRRQFSLTQLGFSNKLYFIVLTYRYEKV